MNLTFTNVDQVCSTVDLSSATPLLDLSDVTFFEPFALVYLGMFLRYHNSRGIEFSVRLPASQQARGYLARQNFWARFNFNPDIIQKESLRRLTKSTSLNDIVDVERKEGIAEDIAEQILLVLRRNAVAVRAAAIAELMSELVDNFAQHSERTLAAVAMQYYPNLRYVSLSIGDCGVGIRSSLASNPKHSHIAQVPHHQAALEAFEPLVSRRAEGGTGLTEVREQTIKLGGSLILATGDGYVTIDQKGTRFGPMAYDLSGVQIQLGFPERKT